MFDPKYIKMVLALPEDFFKDWKWQAGDHASTTYKREVLIISNESVSNCKYPEFLKVMFPYSDDDTPEFFRRKDLRPLLTHNQLLDMILPETPKSEFSNIFFLAWFNGWVRGHDIEWQADKSFECMLLEAVMFTKYNKEWNGKKWL